jgi:hypothetical protein
MLRDRLGVSERWACRVVGHHSAAFTLATYVHLLDGDLGEPLSIFQADRRNAESTGWAPKKALPSTEQ